MVINRLKPDKKIRSSSLKIKKTCKTKSNMIHYIHICQIASLSLINNLSRYLNFIDIPITLSYPTIINIIL